MTLGQLIGATIAIVYLIGALAYCAHQIKKGN